MKVLKFNHENGAILVIPMKHIAEHRARYYAEIDKDTTFEEEVNYIMDDDFAGIDWFRNNMNPEDVEEFIAMIREPERKSLCDLVAEADVSISTIERKP